MYHIYSINHAGRLFNFGPIRVGAHLRWALINFLDFQGGRLFEVGAYSDFKGGWLIK